MRALYSAVSGSLTVISRAYPRFLSPAPRNILYTILSPQAAVSMHVHVHPHPHTNTHTCTCTRKYAHHTCMHMVHMGGESWCLYVFTYFSFALLVFLLPLLHEGGWFDEQYTWVGFGIVCIYMYCVDSRWFTWVVRVDAPQKIFKLHSQISRVGMWTICFHIPKDYIFRTTFLGNFTIMLSIVFFLR